MFILAADIMTRGQSANRLIDMVMAFIGHIRGGLAVSTASACALFGAVSGSTQATVVAVGTPLERPAIVACIRVPQNQSVLEITHLTCD